MTKKKHQFACPIRGTLNVFAGRWKSEILWHLKDGCMRFNQLQRSIGNVSQKMLTQQLRELERDGLVKRTQYPEIPPRVEYEYTDLANSLAPIFETLVEWSDKNYGAVSKARQKYDNLNNYQKDHQIIK
ncbi:winged helix-turn-helix transcriptional regulator [Candidatus Marithrix sp. Canyon 246]|uniref:winged helix-turn-helix transcriptional regulator n=1 Tax=Candidatus Marithrix sp. Canyon 246 TaxID=1827136 RepID=UPI00084A16CE|nr:helix-turn-helix domain-containing protein [Candidatus Marithrix sp. Canyon 246]